MTSEPTRPILCYSSVVNREKGNFTNFENSHKINKNSYNLRKFFHSGDREKKAVYISNSLLAQIP